MMLLQRLRLQLSMLMFLMKLSENVVKPQA
jgi:hypothetical protein